MDIITSVLIFLIGLFVGISLIILINHLRLTSSAKKATEIIKNASTEASIIKRDYLMEAKEEAHKYRTQIENELREKKQEMTSLEARMLTREENLERRDVSLQNREKNLDNKELNCEKKQNELQIEIEKIGEIQTKQIKKLEEISLLSKEDAKELLFENLEKELTNELSLFIKEKEDEAKLSANKKSKGILVDAMQRYAADVATEQTVTIIQIDSDDIKGKIIGREGRNIRTLEAVTGVDIIIDDTPEAFVISSFDPYRREIARVAIEALIKDGRIHPARIEEIYDKTMKEMHEKTKEIGEETLFELGITKVDPEMVFLLGKLNYRFSYGQNALEHSKEVAYLSGLLAAEVGENEILAKRAGLLHDIGKSIDHDVEGSHIDLGKELALKYGENETVVDAIETHHTGSAKTVVAELVAIADALSASRPGARNDSTENYIKRLKDLENIANEFSGIDKAYAIQAGRELRVIVKPDIIDEVGVHKIARDIKNKIEDTLQYPGSIKVTIIREVRAVEEAK